MGTLVTIVHTDECRGIVDSKQAVAKYYCNASNNYCFTKKDIIFVTAKQY